jgi:RNA polymerase sigma-70 factor (ECF subfamily)
LRPEVLRGSPPEVLVDAARRGDRGAFDELVRRYRPRIFALALHITGCRSDADDVVQDAFLRAYHSLGAFRGQSQFFTWLYRIAVNRALNHKRDRGRRRAVSLDDDRIRAAVAVDAAGDPRRALDLAEDYALLLAALDALSPGLRAAVILVALQGMSHREAAAVLETSEGTIGWRMHEARKRLSAALAEAPRRAPRPEGQRVVRRLEQLLGVAALTPETVR